MSYESSIQSGWLARLQSKLKGTTCINHACPIRCLFSKLPKLLNHGYAECIPASCTISPQLQKMAETRKSDIPMAQGKKHLTFRVVFLTSAARAMHLT